MEQIKIKIKTCNANRERETIFLAGKREREKYCLSCLSSDFTREISSKYYNPLPS